MKLEKMKQALIKIGVIKPYLNVALLRLKIVELEHAPFPLGAVSKNLVMYINTRGIEKLTVDEVCFLIEHEIWHVLMNHFSRRQTKEPERWNVAADIAINQNITDFIMCEGGMCHQMFNLPENLSVEEYYDKLPENFKDKLRKGKKSKRAASPDSSDSEVDEEGNEEETVFCGSGSDGLKKSWENEEQKISDFEKKILIENVAKEMSRFKGTLPGGLQEWVDATLRPPVTNWRVVFAKDSSFSIFRGTDDFSYSKFNKKSIKIVKPGLICKKTTAGVVIDTSGSISDKELSNFIGELNNVVQQNNGEIFVTFCDTEATPVEKMDRKKAVMRICGRGGTDLTTGITLLKQKKLKKIIVFTDGYTPWPDDSATLKQLYVVLTKNGYKPPEGVKYVEMND